MSDADKFEQDLNYALVYLTGYSQEDRAGVPRKKFLSRGSAFEDDCRRALARVLRSGRPLPGYFVHCLADMFEPREDALRAYSSRELVAKNRSNHRREDTLAVSCITNFVWERSEGGVRVEKAVGEAIEKFGVSREYVYRLWSRKRKIYEALEAVSREK
jgi:hypothetical protein